MLHNAVRIVPRRKYFWGEPCSPRHGEHEHERPHDVLERGRPSLAIYMAVYMMTSLVEQTTTPSTLAVFDASASVSEVVFVDKDTDAQEIGGTIGWAPPANSQSVFVFICFVYRAYLASDASGAARVAFANDIGEGSNEMTLPAETALGSLTHIVVYMASSLVEQTSPAAAGVSDIAASVINVSFPDLDLDEGDISGTVTWMMPSDRSVVTNYIVHWATDATGANRSQIATVPSGSGDITVPAGTALEAFSHFAVFTMTSFVEQTIPEAHIIDSKPVRPTPIFRIKTFIYGSSGACLHSLLGGRCVRNFMGTAFQRLRRGNKPNAYSSRDVLGVFLGFSCRHGFVIG